MSGTTSGTITGDTAIGYTGAIVTETVATTGYYDITAIGAAGGGAQGGTAAGGDGAEIGGTVLLTAGETIEIAVGGAGNLASDNNQPGGGGGGTFVVSVAGSVITPIVVAGGGSGATYFTPGNNAVGVTGTGGAGVGGMGGGIDDLEGPAGGGGGGGGLTTGGAAGATNTLTFADGPPNTYPGGNGGASFASGAAGGASVGRDSGSGGFGGGGGAGEGGGPGGGGGFDGGNGGSSATVSAAGGGTSYDSGANQFTDLGVGTGNGSVTILLHTAPTIAGVEPSETASGTAALAPFSMVTIGAENATVDVTATITLSSTANGTLGHLGTGSLSGNTYTVVGTEAQDTAAIDGLTFTPAGTPDTITSTIFTFGANDGVENATSTPATALTVTQPAVTISATPASETVSTTDEAAAAPFSGVTINDPNAGQTETAVVSVGTAANGTLSDPHAATDGSTAGNGTITISGSAAAVAADLDGLIFTPTEHQVAPGAAVSTTITGVITDTAKETTSLTSTVNAIAVNDAPRIAGTVAGQATQDTAPIKPFATAMVTDVDTGVQDSLTIVLSNPANGTLSGTGLTAGSTAGTYTLAAAASATLTAELQALTFTPTPHQAAAGTTVTTTFTLTASQTAGGTTATTTNSTVSVVATETTAYNVINGPAGGFGIILGTPGNDQITAFGSFNAIFGGGGNDLINAGNGEALVTLGGGNSSVTLGGGYNAVVGATGNITVTGGPGGHNAVTLGNGNDTVTVGGTSDIITLGAGTDMVNGTQGMAFITTGGGNDTIVLGGAGNTVNAGGGRNTISGGTGNNTFVLPAASQGFDSISGFSETNGDVLNLQAALAGTKWNGQSSTLANYLKVTDSGGSATLGIVPSGSGSATAIASLVGAGNLGLSDLISHHSLVT